MENKKNDITNEATIVKSSTESVKIDPYRNLLIGAVNELIEREHISLEFEKNDPKQETGHIFLNFLGHNSVINWRNIGYGELRISLWWKYDHSRHPQANVEGNSKECFQTSQPLAKKQHFPNFVGVVASCWLERKDGRYIQGEKRDSIFDIYTRKGELSLLKELAIQKPNGYEISGPIRL